LAIAGPLRRFPFLTKIEQILSRRNYAIKKTNRFQDNLLSFAAGAEDGIPLKSCGALVLLTSAFFRCVPRVQNSATAPQPFARIADRKRSR
jgi:hypothetical protein